MEISVKELARELGLELIAPAGADGHKLAYPLTDSRSLLYPDKTLFFPLTTSSNDGHNYIPELYSRGVRHFVVTRYYYNKELENKAIAPDATFLIVDHGTVLDVLQRTGALIRSRVDCPVMAVTGSRGKTVMKELLADACEELRTVTSPRSWNSQTGVPLSLWRLEKDTELGIFEAGISKPGEMARLEAMLRPTIGIFTSLTDEHSRGFSDDNEKCREKALLFKNCPHIIYIEGNDAIPRVLHELYPDRDITAARDYREAVALTRALLGLPAGEVPEIHTLSARIDITEGRGGSIYASDRFSNTVDSISSALDFLARRTPAGYPINVILGDLQLRGEDATKAYRRLARLLRERRVSKLITIGAEIGRYSELLAADIDLRSYSTPRDFIEAFNPEEFTQTAVLIKGAPASNFDAIKQRLEDARHPTTLEVNLDSIIHNFNYYRSLVRKETGIVAMVKADAYGAGAVEISRTLQAQGADYLAVAVVEEGLELRRGGISMPVMVLNPIVTDYSALFHHRLEPTVFSITELDTLSRHLPAYTDSYPIHIKLDTGMHRFGFQAEQLPALVEALERHPRLKVASIFSHLATADVPEMEDYTQQQLAAFESMSTYLLEQLPYRTKRHILNTAGIMAHPECQYDMVRLGIGLYGISPLTAEQSRLRTVSTLSTHISALQTRKAGDTVGYGRRGKIERDSVIATIPIGYADGFNRHLGNGNTCVMVNGRLCPTVGNICMDICMIDVTDADARVGDRVEIFGANVPVSKLAEALYTIPYEVFTSLAPRVKRIYFSD